MSKPRDELSKKVVTPYVDTLDDVSKRRYLQKIAAVKNIDPYENEDWSDDAKTFPPLDKCDVFEYLVNRTSYYTRERFKAMKQLGAHNQLTSGWVKKMYTHRPHGCENTIITSQVSSVLSLFTFCHVFSSCVFSLFLCLSDSYFFAVYSSTVYFFSFFKVDLFVLLEKATEEIPFSNKST